MDERKDVQEMAIRQEELTANRLHLASEDMRETLKYLEAYCELVEADHQAGTDQFSTHCSAILQLAIVCYCRNFIASQNKNKADVLIPLKDIQFFEERDDFRALHKLLITKRHKLIAHSDWKYHTTKLNKEIVEDFTVVRHSKKHNPCAGIDVYKFIELIQNLTEEFDAKAFQLDRQILDIAFIP